MLFVGMRATVAATLIPQVLPAAFSEAVYQAAVLDCECSDTAVPCHAPAAKITLQVVLI